jgi:diguanylate cyclase (GGDEF)-like protein
MSGGRCMLTARCHTLPADGRSRGAILIGSVIGAGGPGLPGRNMRGRRHSSLSTKVVGRPGDGSTGKGIVSLDITHDSQIAHKLLVMSTQSTSLSSNFVIAPLLRGLEFKLFPPVILATVLAILAATVGLYHAATESDAIAVERQVRETRQAIDSSLDELAINQEAIAVWDDPYLQLQKPEPDWVWMDENIGTWLNSLFGHDQVYILNAQDLAVYGTRDGARVEADSFVEIAAGLTHLIDGVRGRVADHTSVHERLPGRPLHPSATVRTTEKAIHTTAVVNISGRPAAASAMLIRPHTPTVNEPPGAHHILISIRFLDGNFLQQLAKGNLIEGPRFSKSASVGKGEHAWSLMSDHDEPLSHFIWRPELPGTKLLRSVAPSVGFALALIVLIMTLLAIWLHRAISIQQRTLVELRASEAQAQHLAFHDALTGLPNRTKFDAKLYQELVQARRGKRLAILLLDLDGFKHVNDALGHLAGDALIREFADRVHLLLRGEDMVARLGGDEFVILISDLEAYGGVEALCGAVLNAVKPPFELLGNAAFVGVSIGVALAPDAGCERIDLMRKADIALYQAKAQGRGCYRFFTPEMDDSVMLRSAIEEQLRVALENGSGLLVHYQPQVTGKDWKITGLEALVRWQHPTLGLIAPAQFVAVAEGSGLISALGDWVLRQACAASHRWPHLFIAVNLSPAEFRINGFAERITQTVRDCGADPRRIELEITEGVLLDDSEAVRHGLAVLRAAGFRIALDDFGTGYSSLSYLRRFEVDKIKIDRSFVQHLGHAVDSTAIISAVLMLGRIMGLHVTAEGVETPEQQEFLEAAGCESMQGYLFSRPVPESEVDSLLVIREPERGAA